MTLKKQFFVNGHEFYTDVDITLFDLIYYFNYTTSLFVLEYNNLICDKIQWDKIIVGNKDKIEIVTIVGGG
jgi:thiamine biosynthesis protein ThiS